MIHDAEVPRYDFVLQHGAGRYVDPVSVVSDDDDGALGGSGKLILKSFFFFPFFFLQHFYQSRLNCILKADYNISSRRSRRLEKLFLWQFRHNHLHKLVKLTQKQENVIFEGQGVIVRPSHHFT